MPNPENIRPESTRKPFRADAVLLAVLAYGTVLRIFFLWEPVRLDEFYTYFNYVIYPFRHILSTYDVPNNHIFHSLLARCFYLLGGTSEAVLRLPAFIAGCALIPAVYGLALALDLSRNSARFAAFFTASSGGLLYYSVNARGYSVQALLAVLCSLVYLSRGRAALPAASLALLCALNVLVLYTVPTGLIFVLPFFVFLFLDRGGMPRGRLAVLAACGLLLTALLHAPVLRQLAAAMHGAVGGPLLPVLGVALSSLTPGVMPAFLLALFAVAGLFYSPKSASRLLFFCSLLLLPLLGIAVLALIFPSATLLPRSFLVLFPFVYVLAAGGMETVLRAFSGWRLRALAVICALVLLRGVWEDIGMAKNRRTLFYPDRDIFDYYRSSVRKTVEGFSQSGDCIVGTGAADSLAAFYTFEKDPFFWCNSKDAAARAALSRIFILADSPGNLIKFCRRVGGPGKWLPPEALHRYGEAGLYVLRRHSDHKK